MSRENYYILLGLDPAEQDLNTILQALRSRQSQWSIDRNSPSPRKRNDAQRYLGLVRDIEQLMRDDERRKAEADEARKELQARRAAVLEELDSALRVTAAKGYLDEGDITSLVGRFRGKLTEAEVRERITRQKLEVRQASPSKVVRRPMLESTVYQNIREDLVQVGKKDLYDFLDAPRSCTVAALRQKADEMYRLLRQFVEKTALIGAAQRLTGHAQVVFASDEERAKYDASLADEQFDALRSLAETAGAGEKRISAQLMDELLKEGVKQGLDTDEVRQVIIDLAARKGWPVAEPARASVLDLQRCGVCLELGAPTEANCRRCGTPFKAPCPRCKTVNSSEAKYCTKQGCGFAIGNMPLASRLARDARVALEQKDRERASLLVAEALGYWPDMPEALAVKGDLQKQRQAEQQALEKVEQAIIANLYQGARAALEDLRRLVPAHPRLPDLEGRIDKILTEAAGHVARARQLEQQGKPDEALLAYSDALRACADHQEARDGLNRCPPAPCPALSAAVAGKVVALKWQASLSPGEVRYRVVRKARSEPRHPSDGEVLTETTGMSFSDTTALAGEAYYYAIWAVRGSAASSRGALTGPLLRVEDVTDLRATAGSRSVVLDYKAPARARGVEVWRQAGAEPKGRTDGTRVATSSLTSAADTGLTNGQLYGYRVVCVFEGPDGLPLYSPGVTCTVMPVELPEPVRNLRVERRGSGQFEVSWLPPPSGQVQVYARDSRPAIRAGEIISANDLPQLGSRLIATGGSSVKGQVPANGDLFLMPVTVLGSAVVAGEGVALGWVEDVEGLSVQVSGGTLSLRWGWPVGVDAAVIAWRSDRFPSGAEDPQAKRDLFDRPRYESNGGYRCPVPAVEELFLCVHAAVRRGEGWQYATGASEGARVQLPVGKARTLWYRVVPRMKWWVVRTGEYELRLLSNAPTTLPGLVLAYKPGGLPLDPQDGTPLVGVLAGHPCSHEEPLVIPFTPPPDFTASSARLFPLDEDHCAWLEAVFVP